MHQGIDDLAVPLNSPLDIGGPFDGVVDNIDVMEQAMPLATKGRELVALQALLMFSHRNNEMGLDHVNNVHLDLGSQALDPSAGVYKEDAIFVRSGK